MMNLSHKKLAFYGLVLVAALIGLVIDRTESASAAGETIRPDWNDALRNMELTDALARSVVKGRTIEIKLDGETEEATFKGVMTSLGCSLILLALGLLFATTVIHFLVREAGLETLANAIRDTLPFVLLAMFILFLALQVLKLVIRGSSDEDEQGDPPAG